MIDTGAAKNYIKILPEIKNILPVEKRFLVHSIHGKDSVKEKCYINLFGVNTPFFILNSLSTFDGIIGLDLLKRVNAKIDLKAGQLSYNTGVEKLNFFECKDVNFIEVDKIEVPFSIRTEFQGIIKKRIKVFADPNEALPYNTNIVATIRMEDEEPVYSKLYPYPMGVADFVNAEVKKLLADGIIRPSRSPFNSPVWVVDKKGVDDLGNKKKRLVIDFRKLNHKTIDDKYPVPNISVILSNLGRAKYFTTLDLKSGFHQIELAERDREKMLFQLIMASMNFADYPLG